MVELPATQDRVRHPLRFSKLHGAGNDYVYIDARDLQLDWPSLAVAMSDRHLGVGSDGLILVLRSDVAHLRMRMFNADGSEGEMCGNGIRCFVRYAFDNGMLREETSQVTVETLAGVKSVTPFWERDAIVRAAVGMGAPRLRAEEIPVNLPGRGVVLDYPMQIDGHRFAVSCVSMGNPHAVAFVDDPVGDFPLREIGPLVERSPLFPDRVNFEIANVASPRLVKARVWERGSGLTEACGSGACAVAVAARLHGYVGDEVSIDLPGGSLSVTWPGHGDVVLEGPVAHVFDGEWPL